MSSKWGAFLRSLVLLAVAVVGVPAALVAAARARFDGSAPWSAMVPVDEWSAATVRDALTDRLTDSTIADIVIRVALTTAWMAVVVLLVTVVAEMVHMVRHGGLALPPVRGLGMTQSLARVIAAGLLVVVPLVGSANRAIANDASSALLPESRIAASLEHGARPESAWVDASPAAAGSVVSAPQSAEAESGDGARVEAPSEAGGVSTYVVKAGDSIYSIAERMAGPDQRAVTEYADQLLELNLGHQMNDGRTFSNAALIDIGWELELPGAPAAGAGAVVDDVHVVEAGESLWSIADDELGDPERWPELYEANRGRSFDDGRTFDDPDLIQPGWDLDLGTDGDDAAVETEAADEAPDAADAVETSDGASVGGESDVVSPDPATGPTVVEGVVGEETARPSNAWVDSSPDDAAVTVPAAQPSRQIDPIAGGVPAGVSSPDAGASDPAESPADGIELLTYRRAAMLSAGLLTLLAVRRRSRMREARSGTRLPPPQPEVVSTERALRAIDAGERFARVDIAIRHAALPLADAGARVQAVAVANDGAIELFASASVELAAPWEAVAGVPDRWLLPASVPVELLADGARRVGAPCPTLVQLGRETADRDLYVDLEGLGAIEVGGPGDQADAVVAAVASTLAASVLAEVTTLVGVGVPDDAFLDHRHHRPVRSAGQGFSVAADAVGSTAMAERSTFDLRARVTSGETWEPAVVLVGSAVGTVAPPRDHAGLAVVSASPIHGPSSRLAPDGDAWTLMPLGVRLTPVGLTLDDIVAVAALIDVPGTQPPAAPSLGSDDTILGSVGEHLDAPVAWPDEPEESGVDVVPHELVVRMLGPVSVESADRRVVDFERSKTRELIAWLATHRERATRSNARAALWELDVRDATFANVVSEARRALARCVEPPEGDEWVARTMTDSLPLHELVVTDAQLVEHALATARLQPPDQALATLRPALDWVVGTPFEGTSYLWPDAEGIASDLVLTALTLCDAYAQHALSVGDVEGVFDATGRGLQVLPAHEDMIAVRMQAYAQAGDRAGVRHEWESYERVITADPWSDGEPSERMLDLRHELLAGPGGVA